MRFNRTAVATFDRNLALELAKLCEQAYTDSTVQSDETGAHALIEDDILSIRVACRGTQTVQDFLRDGQFWQAKTWGGHVHAGFNTDANSIIVPLILAVKKLLAEHPRPVYLTGHSLGGSECVLIAETFFRQGVGLIAAVYTFGQPRTFDFCAARAYNNFLAARTVRVVNEPDLVPHIPPPGLILRYWHHQTEALLRQSGTTLVRRSLARRTLTDGGKVLRARKLLKDTSLWDSVRDHHAIQTYINRLTLGP